MANLNLSEFTEKLFVADADHTFIWDTAASISKRVSRNSWLNSGTLTSDAPVTISQTWDNAAVAFTGLKVNATSTNSAAGSLLLDLQVGGVSQFKVDKSGVATLSADGVPQLRMISVTGSGSVFNGLTLESSLSTLAGFLVNRSTGEVKIGGLSNAGYFPTFYSNNAERMRITTAGNVGIGTTSPTSKLDIAGAVTAAGYYTATSGGVSLVANGLWQQGTGHLTLASGAILGWSGQANVNIDQPGDTRLQRDEAYHLALRNGTNGQKFSVYGTYPNATAWERFTITAPTSGNVLLGTYKGTDGIARGLEFQTNGVTRMTIGASGITYLEGNNNVISGFRFYGLGSNSLLIDNGVGSFNRLLLGGTSSSYPALKRVGSEFQIVKADTTAADNVAAGDADLTFIEDRYRRKGAGTPEGVVTAPIGAVYHNTTGGAGTSFYVKESGTGNTGWVGK